MVRQRMTFALVAIGAAAAVCVELIEALAIVLAVGVTRRWSDAVVGSIWAVVVCGALAVLVGPVLLSSIPLDMLRLTIGAMLLLFGLEWLRKGTLRLAGRRSRSSSMAEFLKARDALHDAPLPAPGQPDWTGRLVAFKGVLLEGVEVVLIVSALAARPSGPAPAICGAALATLLVAASAAWVRKPLARIPETELKWGVGVLLSAFGLFFAGEGLGYGWPGGDAAILYLVVLLGMCSHGLARQLAREPRPA